MWWRRTTATLMGVSFGTYKRRIRTTETSWWRTNETSVGVSFETCLRCRKDVPMRRRCYVLSRRRHGVPIRCRGDVPLRRLGDVPSRRRWVFHLRCNCDDAEMYRETLLRHRHDVLLPGGLHMLKVMKCNFANCFWVSDLMKFLRKCD